MISFLTFATITILLANVLLIIIRKRKHDCNIPTGGPLWLPVLGNLLQIVRKPHRTLSRWAAKYGKLYTLHLGQKPALVVNDQQLIKELFGMMAATGQFKTGLMTMVTNGNYGIGNSDGNVWQEQKQFCLKALKEYGFGKANSIEPIILEEVDDLCTWIENEQLQTGKLYMNQKLKHSFNNLLWTMVTGKRTKTTESKVVHLVEDWMKHLQIVTRSGLMFFPWIKYLAPVRSGYHGFKAASEKMYKYVEREFVWHKLTKKTEEPPRDMIDAYIENIDACEDPQSSFHGVAGWRHSLAAVTDLLLAGGETTATVINWMIYYLSVHPEVQKKMQEEIDRVIGKDDKDNPSLDDQQKMPYLEAVTLETFRYATLVPLGVMHELSEDVVFQGYHLPKGLLLIPNLYHVHNDKSVWGDPEVFRPERFMEGVDDFKNFVIPFQPGRRSCPGESLSKDIIFLYAAKLFQKYAFSVDKSVENVQKYLEPEAGYLLLPKKLGVKARPRN